MCITPYELTCPPRRRNSRGRKKPLPEAVDDARSECLLAGASKTGSGAPTPSGVGLEKTHQEDAAEYHGKVSQNDRRKVAYASPRFNRQRPLPAGRATICVAILRIKQLGNSLAATASARTQ